MAAWVMRRVSSQLSLLARPILPSASLDGISPFFPSPHGAAPTHPGFPLPGLGSMELMAVPKKKVSRHKKGLRNGPKALKPVPVIVRCKSCGRVKLPHFYCCSGDRGSNSSPS